MAKGAISRSKACRLHRQSHTAVAELWSNCRPAEWAAHYRHVHPFRQLKRRPGRAAFAAWLDHSGVPSAYVEQSPFTVPAGLKGRIKRPDYLVGVPHAGLLGFDVKAKSLYQASWRSNWRRSKSRPALGDADNIEQERRGKDRSAAADQPKSEADQTAGADSSNQGIGHDVLPTKKRS